MNKAKPSFSSLLVPIDFSPAAHSAFERARQLAEEENGNIVLLHVLDPALVDFAVAHAWGSREEVAAQMRQQALARLESYKQEAGDLEVSAVVCEGTPFLEILSKAEDFAVDAVVMGKVGTRGTIEQLLFGSTAERVIRGSRFPVLVLPDAGGRDPGVRV